MIPPWPSPIPTKYCVSGRPMAALGIGVIPVVDRADPARLRGSSPSSTSCRPPEAPRRGTPCRTSPDLAPSEPGTGSEPPRASRALGFIGRGGPVGVGAEGLEQPADRKDSTSMPEYVVGVERPITGYHQDELGDWVAELDCGHNQHVRHRPPFQLRPGSRSRGANGPARDTPGVSLLSAGGDARCTALRAHYADLGRRHHAGRAAPGP